MVEILEELKQNQILHGKSVAALRKYITQKYPDDSPNKVSAIFADAINKIIDTNIAHFDSYHRVHIKKNLYKQMAKKEIFTINAYEIFEACTHLETEDSIFIKSLTEWINSNQSQVIQGDEVRTLALELRATFTYNTLNSESTEPVLIESEPVMPLILPIDEPIQIIRKSLPPIQLPEIPELTTPIKDGLFDKIAELCNDIGMDMVTWFRKHTYKWLIPLIIMVALFVFYEGFFAATEPKAENISAPYLLDLTASMATFENDIAPFAKYVSIPFEYQEINRQALNNWLAERKSLLAEEPYFTGIITAAKEFNVHPLLLFAITGQEQAFVPKSTENASVIANNPFNVFGSWQAYNTNIEDASRIAAKTIVNLRMDCPENMSVIQWINRKYAEDADWHVGVSKIFLQLEANEVTEGDLLD